MGVLAVAAGGLWLARKPIADRFIARTLAAYGIEGRYEVTRIGPRTQRIEHLVIGDPRAPDLTVRQLEVDIGIGFSGARIDALRAEGVRLRGRLADGRLSLGQLDRLLQGGTTEAAALPDWTVALRDAQAAIATPYGPVTLTAAGQGYLPDGFRGTLAGAAGRLRFGDCALDGLSAPIGLTTSGGQIVLDGPLRSRRLDCEGTALALPDPQIDLNLRSDPGLADLSLAASFSADGLTQAGRRFGRLSGLLTMKGGKAAWRGSAALSAESAQLQGLATDAAKLRANFAMLPAVRDHALAITGVATLDNARAARGVDLGALVRSAAGTPLEPLAARLIRAIGEAQGANRTVVGGGVNLLGTHGNATFDQIEFTSDSGARIALQRGGAIRAKWPDGAVEAAGTLVLSGGDLPEGRITLATGPQGLISGTAALDPYGAGAARLALAPVRFSLTASGTGRISTTATLDGPLPDGGVTGLVIPVDARLGPGGSVQLAGDCAPLRWQSLRLSSLALDPATLRLCGIARKDLRLGPVRLTGTMGESPFQLAAASARYAPGSGVFALETPDVRIGEGESPVRMAARRLSGGAVRSGGFGGTIEGGTGRIGPVPLDLTGVAGRWTFADGRLAVDGGLRVSDTAPDPRFVPLDARNVHLTLSDGRIDVTGALVQPARNVEVASVTIRHDLSSGAGQADLVVDGLRFGKALRPDDLTSLVTGVVQNVEGRVDGAGHIRWTSGAVTSDGRFSTENMALAAAFGPVEGLSTTIHFVDLLGMRTAPGQVVTLRTANAGVEVTDGTVRYALLSNEEARIEGGHWPFAGGDLDLLPATIALDSHKPRALTFRVVGLDAGAFINTLDLKNVSATGTFDGLLPMIFDERGGRIEGGVLIARQAGDAPRILETTQGLDVPCDPDRQAGNLAYVGDVSNAQLNMYGKMAFDALKNLRYRCLTIFLDGALDGEFVTRVSVNGVNQGTEEARNSLIARQFLGLPFIFNVRIEAPFRGLLSTASGLADPTMYIHQNMPAPAPAAPATNTDGLAVQPPDSENDAERDQE